MVSAVPDRNPVRKGNLQMKERLKTHKQILLLLGTASFYFLSVDVLADMAMAPVFGGTFFLLLRAAYLLTMSAGFLSYPALVRRFGHGVLLPAAGAGIPLLPGIALLRSPALLASCILLSLFLSGLFGAAAYARTASVLRDDPCLGRLSTCGMGLGSLFQVVISVFPFTLLWYALIIGASLGLTALLLRSELETVPAGVLSRDSFICAPREPSPSFLRAFLLCTALISFMGGINDGELALLQAEGILNLQAWPRLLYFAGMILAGTVYDLRGFRGLSILVFFVMICSETGAVFMNNPSAIVLDEALYSTFAGIVIIFFTVPLFSCGGHLLPSLGRAVRLPALALGMLFYEFFLRQLPSVVTIVVYVLLTALLALLFVISGFTAGRTEWPAMPDAASFDGEHLPDGPEETGEMALPGDISHDDRETSGSAPRELHVPDDSAAFAHFCETYGLTQREADIMRIILRSDLPTTQLSGELHVSERTLYRRLSALYQKTGTDSRVGLLMKYYGGSKV